jgi:1,4-alpha-glucan branching enzyme
MIKRELKNDQVHLTFVLPSEEPAGKVSVVGDFNEWRPGAHTLVRRSNGTRSVKVTVPAGTTLRFRYLGEGGHWFDDPQVEQRDREDGLLLA